jgi:hypothetical protein
MGVDDPRHYLAYAYLRASVRYEFAFKDNDKPLEFTDGQGKVTPVKAFGIRPQDVDKGKADFRGQVRVLFREGEDFGVDLSKGTKPYQVVLARMPRKASLREALDDFEDRAAKAVRQNLDPDLGDGAVLLVPNMDWRIEHRFQELQGKQVRHPAVPPESVLQRAYQLLQFKMDRRGAVLVSEVAFRGFWQDGAEPQDFRLDRPYLVLLRNRDHRLPFFVMWVDNAELLQPR